VAVLLKVYAKYIDGQDQVVKQRFEDALRDPGEPEEDTPRKPEGDRLRLGRVLGAYSRSQPVSAVAVDPANRLVADTLEADWNTALRALNDAKDAYDKAQNAAAANLAETQKTRIRTLVTDFPAIWNDPATPQRERKRMTRLLLTDVTVTKNAKTITCNMRWQGGQDHTLTLPVPKNAWELRQTAPHIVEAIDQLLDHHTHTEIAAILNARGHTSGEGRPFHPLIVRNIRDQYRLRSRQQRLRDAGMLTLDEMAGQLGVSAGTVKAWRHAGLVSGQCYNDKGQALYHPPGPNPPAPHHPGSPTGDLHKRQTPANRPEEVQCETKGFIRGALKGDDE
jgi:hypothetical protein